MRRLCRHDNVTSLCLAVKNRLATFLEAREHDIGASTMVAQATFSPARVVARSPRHRGTQLFQRETALRQAISLLRRWREGTRMRRQARYLCELDDYVLQDIGLTRAELLWEAAKPYAPRRVPGPRQLPRLTRPIYALWPLRGKARWLQQEKAKEMSESRVVGSPSALTPALQMPPRPPRITSTSTGTTSMAHGVAIGS